MRRKIDVRNGHRGELKKGTYIRIDGNEKGRAYETKNVHTGEMKRKRDIQTERTKKKHMYKCSEKRTYGRIWIAKGKYERVKRKKIIGQMERKRDILANGTKKGHRNGTRQTAPKIGLTKRL